MREVYRPEYEKVSKHFFYMLNFYCYSNSEMFMDTSKFSTKTLSAINGLEGAVIRKNKEYNWRKEMEK